MDWKGKRILGYKDDEKTAYEIGKEKGFPDPVFNPLKGGYPMKRLESIKKKIDRFRRWDKGDQFGYYNDQHLPEFVHDIEYLLQRLERYEKALKDVRDYERLEENWKLATFIEEALKE
jgi:hypothetical protein